MLNVSPMRITFFRVYHVLLFAVCSMVAGRFFISIISIDNQHSIPLINIRQRQAVHRA